MLRGRILGMKLLKLKKKKIRKKLRDDGTTENDIAV